MMKTTFLGFCCLLLFTNFGCKCETKTERDFNVIEMIKYHGYPVETHYVTTRDGYILTIYRIVLGKKDKKRPAVILQHGLLDSAFSWINNGPKKSLAFILADKGFDVWLSNSRGNLYSRRHIRYSPSSRKFWRFTWDEMVTYDLPATIDYVRKTSKVEKVGYVGHSQGGAIGLAGFSSNEDLKYKVSAFVGLAPAAYLGHLKSPIRLIAPIARTIGIVHSILLGGEFLANNDLFKLLINSGCGNKIGSMLCTSLVSVVQGPNAENLNAKRIPIYMSHFPAGTSTMNVLHYAQSYKSKRFQYYDYGWFGNLKHYGQLKVPRYKLDTSPVPTAIFYGGKDWLVDAKDSNITIAELGPSVTLKRYIPRYNHLDFVWGMDAYKVVFPDVIKFLNKYNQ